MTGLRAKSCSADYEAAAPGCRHPALAAPVPAPAGCVPAAPQPRSLRARLVHPLVFVITAL